MDDMQAIEQRITRELVRRAGPSEPVDAAAIFTAIITTQSPKWGFQSMFSATKFVVAGAIVALFGSFLLAGVLTQPSDERVPAALDDSPDPTELLPGVDLVTEEVEPGVYRVLGDGVRDLSRRVRSLAVSPDGDVWLALGPRRNWGLLQIGVPGQTRVPAGQDQYIALAVTHDGLPVLFGSDVTWVLDGEAWAKTELTTFDECVVAATLAQPGISYRVLGADGGCWTRADEVAGAGDATVLVRVDADGTRTEVTGAELGLEPDQGVGHLAVGPDGTVWSTFGRGGYFEPAAEYPNTLHGLLAYDGSSWSVVPYDSEARMAYDALAVGPDGAVWLSWHWPHTVEQPLPSSISSSILSWDGKSWIEHPFVVSEGGRTPLRIRPWPNGVTWFGAVATRWDGADLEEVEPADGWPLPGEGPAATAPDGTTWLVAAGQLYVITREAMEGTEPPAS